MMSFKILRNGKRYNNKVFNTYEEARKYVRRLVTKLAGRYIDGYTQQGFQVVKV